MNFFKILVFLTNNTTNRFLLYVGSDDFPGLGFLAIPLLNQLHLPRNPIQEINMFSWKYYENIQY
jgi:hypothetical protein